MEREISLQLSYRLIELALTGQALLGLLALTARHWCKYCTPLIAKWNTHLLNRQNSESPN